MSNVVDIKGQPVKVAPAFAHLKVKSLSGGIADGFAPILGYRGKVWTLRYQGDTYAFKRDDDGSQLTYIDVIILNSPEWVSKIYYPQGEWDEDAAGAPTCASVKGDAPDPGVPEPQSKACATCKYFGWTTLPTGKSGKLCQDHKRLAVLLMPQLTKKMLGSPLLEPIYLKIPPGSLASLKRYDNMLVHSGLPYPSLITRISFTEKLFEMKFEILQTLSDKEAPTVLPLVDDPRTLRIIGETPTIREVPQTATAVKPARIETGLVEAFADVIEADTFIEAGSDVVGAEPEVIAPASKRGRGRPPKIVEQTSVQQLEPEEAIETVQKVLPKATQPWHEEVSGLDDRVRGLLNQKSENMLK